MVVFYNGKYLEKSQVCISPEDRGFMFADGVYEGIRIYRGVVFKPVEHLARLAESLRKVRIRYDFKPDHVAILNQLVIRNDLVDQDGFVYLQITRGSSPRSHAFPDADLSPTVYITVGKMARPVEKWEKGVKVILVPDERWMHCDIKSIALLANVLASQRAAETGAEEALFVRDGVITEGSHTSFCAVIDGVLRTHPLNNFILPGITRELTLEVCQSLDIPYEERAVSRGELKLAAEAMLLSSTKEVMPVVEIDGNQIGSGVPGPLAKRLLAGFQDLIAQFPAP